MQTDVGVTGTREVHVTHVCFRSAHVDLVGTAEAVGAVLDRSGPWLVASPEPVGRRMATIQIAGQRPTGGDWRSILEQSLPFERAAPLLVNDVEQRVVVDQDDEEWAVHHTLRVLRSALKYASFGPDLMFMHGACVTINGVTMLISGRSRSGKTSTMLTALSNPGSAFLSNDDVTITSRDGELLASGWPRSICVRRDCFDGFRRSGIDVPADRLTLDALRHPSNHWQRNWTEHESIWMFPSEVAGLFGGETQVTARPQAVIFPGFDDDCATTSVLERLDFEAAHAMTSANCETEASHFEVFLKAWVPEPEPTSAALVERVAALPSFRLRQSMGSFASSRALLADVGRQVLVEQVAHRR